MSEAKHDHKHDHVCGEGCAHKHDLIQVDVPVQGYDPAQDPSYDPAIFSETYELVFNRESGTLTVQEVMVHWIEKILEWAKSNHAFVGHIKVFIEGAENLWLSSTGKAINIKGFFRMD